MQKIERNEIFQGNPKKIKRSDKMTTEFEAIIKKLFNSSCIIKGELSNPSGTIKGKFQFEIKDFHHEKKPKKVISKKVSKKKMKTKKVIDLEKVIDHDKRNRREIERTKVGFDVIDASILFMDVKEKERSIKTALQRQKSSMKQTEKRKNESAEEREKRLAKQRIANQKARLSWSDERKEKQKKYARLYGQKKRNLEKKMKMGEI